RGHTFVTQATRSQIKVTHLARFRLGMAFGVVWGSGFALGAASCTHHVSCEEERRCAYSVATPGSARNARTSGHAGTRGNAGTSGSGGTNAGGSAGNAGTSGGNGGDAGAPMICGNGTLEDGEQCDDHNTSPGDGCSADCQREPGFECDTTHSPTS